MYRVLCLIQNAQAQSTRHENMRAVVMVVVVVAAAAMVMLVLVACGGGGGGCARLLCGVHVVRVCVRVCAGVCVFGGGGWRTTGTRSRLMRNRAVVMVCVCVCACVCMGGGMAHHGDAEQVDAEPRHLARLVDHAARANKRTREFS